MYSLIMADNAGLILSALFVVAATACTLGAVVEGTWFHGLHDYGQLLMLFNVQCNTILGVIMSVVICLRHI